MKFKMAPKFLNNKRKINKVLEKEKIIGFIMNQKSKKQIMIIGKCTRTKSIFKYLIMIKNTNEVEEIRNIGK